MKTTYPAFKVRIPPITDLETAIRIYYENIEIGNKEIIQLFGKMGSQKIWKMKDIVKKKMLQEDIPFWNACRVNTKAAYSEWGLDIKDLEYRYNRLKKYTQKDNDKKG